MGFLALGGLLEGLPESLQLLVVALIFFHIFAVLVWIYSVSKEFNGPQRKIRKE